MAKTATKRATTSTEVDLAGLRASRVAAQGFGAETSVVGALGRGPIRTLGGIDAYLALFARAPGVTVAAIHAAVMAGDARVVPAARGCIYLVAQRDVPWALALAERLSAPRAAKEHAKVGIEARELALLGDAVVQALAAGPATTDAIKKALPAGLVRSLGDVGKKVGISSTQPPALRLLELSGRIERTLAGGRLDSERYLWRATSQPLAPVAEPEREAARVFFRAAGVGTDRDLAAWFGLSLTAAKEALDGLALEDVATPLGPARAWPGAAADPWKGVAFLPFEDNVVALHHGPAYLVDSAHHDLAVVEWGGRGTVELGTAKHMFLRSVLVDDRIAAFWEWDPSARRVVVGHFAPPAKALASRVAKAAEALGEYVRTIGHGRSFSLDTDEALSGRCEQIRALRPRV